MNLSELPKTIVHDLYSTFCMENAEVHHPRRATTTVHFLHYGEQIATQCHWRPIGDTHFSAHFSIEPRDTALCVDVVVEPGNASAFIRVYFAGKGEPDIEQCVHTLEEWRELVAPEIAKMVETLHTPQCN